MAGEKWVRWRRQGQHALWPPASLTWPFLCYPDFRNGSLQLGSSGGGGPDPSAPRSTQCPLDSVDISLEDAEQERDRLRRFLHNPVRGPAPPPAGPETVALLLGQLSGRKEASVDIQEKSKRTTPNSASGDQDQELSQPPTWRQHTVVAFLRRRSRWGGRSALQGSILGTCHALLSEGPPE